MLATLFSIPAVIILLQKRPFIFPSFGSRVAQITLWSPTELHMLGWFGIIVAAALLFLYFYARWSIGREEKASPPHFLDV